ncbi:MAG: DUF1732 domain-containing protein [Candidatus Cloacimonadota bacterium]|nr:DUF1732 domain-containing protein [Candidatus Cloacimonadota bacterium]
MKSMTGFGSEELNKDGLNLKITARSLNDKYLNIRCKTPPDFPEYVSYKIERMIPKLLSRGTIYITLFRINKKEKLPEMLLKEDLLKQYFDFINEVSKKYAIKTNITISDIFNFEKLYQSPIEEYDSEEFLELVLKLVKKAVNKLIEVRQKEGEDLEEFFIKSINQIEVSLSAIELSFPDYLQELKLKTKSNIEEILKNYLKKIDEEKIISEIKYLCEKLDITEEIVRFRSHLNKFRELISIKDKPIGFSLIFVIQEMQREISTISAKYNNISVFPEILKIKEETEKCKEQALNVE